MNTAVRRTVLFATALVVVVFATHLCSSGERADSPNNNAWSFGTVRPGSTLKHLLSTRNDTGDRWQVLGATATCGCVRILRTSTAVGPGETLEVEVSIDTVGRRGPQSSTIDVEISPGERHLRFYVSGRVLPDAVFDPPGIHACVPRIQENFTAKTRLFLSRGVPTAPSVLYAPPCVSEACFTPLDDSDSAFELTVKGSLPLGSEEAIESIIVHFAESSTISVGLLVERSEGVTVSPKHVLIPDGDSAPLFVDMQHVAHVWRVSSDQEPTPVRADGSVTSRFLLDSRDYSNGESIVVELRSGGIITVPVEILGGL